MCVRVCVGVCREREEVSVRGRKEGKKESRWR
jgi:hypothetical protein